MQPATLIVGRRGGKLAVEKKKIYEKLLVLARLHYHKKLSSAAQLNSQASVSAFVIADAQLV